MGMLDSGSYRGRGAQLAIEIKRMAPFINTPSIILAAPDEVRRFPEVLTVVACPNLSGLLVDAQPPRVAQAVGPVFGSRVRHRDKRIVPRHRVTLRSTDVIDIDAQHTAEQLAQVLAAIPSI